VLFGDCTNLQGRSEAHEVWGGGGAGVKGASFYKNNDFFTQILPENVKIYSILDFS
jgi:hypothetical protein